MLLFFKEYIFSSRSLLVALGAIAMGFISGRLLFDGSALNTIPWGILALLTGFIVIDKRRALALGGIFGFVVSYSFLWFNNTDIKSLDQVLVLIALVILPALFGLLCGTAMAWLGWKIRSELGEPNA